MPNFPENTGFKMPGIGSKEISTPGGFRADQGVEEVGYCDNTESHMLPSGSSPLTAKDAKWMIPEYYPTTYTSSRDSAESKEGAKKCSVGMSWSEEEKKCVAGEAQVTTEDIDFVVANMDQTG